MKTGNQQQNTPTGLRDKYNNHNLKRFGSIYFIVNSGFIKEWRVDNKGYTQSRKTLTQYRKDEKRKKKMVQKKVRSLLIEAKHKTVTKRHFKRK